MNTTRPFLIAALVLVLAPVALADTAHARTKILKGTFDIDWSSLLLFRQNSTPILDTSGNDIGTDSTSEFSLITGITPKYFVVDNVSVGVTLGYALLNRNQSRDFDDSSANDTDTTISDTGIPVLVVGHYHAAVGDHRYFFIGGGLGWTFAGSREVPDPTDPNRTINSDLSGFIARGELGLMVYLSKQVNVRATLTGLYRNLTETQENTTGSDDLEKTSSTIDAGFGIGVGYSF